MKGEARHVQIGEVAQMVGRSTDTLKRWEDEGLLIPARDARGRRVYREPDLDRAQTLAHVGVRAQFSAKKMSALLDEIEHRQLTLLM